MGSLTLSEDLMGGKGRGEEERSKRERKRNRKRRSEEVGRREQGRRCLFGKELERKELGMTVEGRFACLSRPGRE